MKRKVVFAIIADSDLDMRLFLTDKGYGYLVPFDEHPPEDFIDPEKYGKGVAVLQCRSTSTVQIYLSDNAVIAMRVGDITQNQITKLIDLD